MHKNEIQIDLALVQQLVNRQFPQWAAQSLTRLASAGTDNAMFRLGNDKVIRLPRIAWSVQQVHKEQRWLPHLALHLPLQLPLPLAMGAPDDSYPHVWSIYRWLDGENATLDALSNADQAASDLARFLIALRQIDASAGPPPGRGTGQSGTDRGAPLAPRDGAFRDALSRLKGMIDAAAALHIWERVLTMPDWEQPPVWIHGDLQSGNLLAQAGRLTAVIDWGCMGVGDPAVDTMVAWTLFSAESRQTLRKTLQPDDATWERGRGWALSFGVIALPYYMHTNPGLANIARYTIGEIIKEG